MTVSDRTDVIRRYPQSSASTQPAVEPPKAAGADSVNHPSHYNQGEVECIDAIESCGVGYHLGNAIKYIWRAKHKGSEIEDLEKATWYIKRRIELLRKRIAKEEGNP